MEPWPIERIGDLGEVFTGRTPSTEQPSYFGRDYPFITPGDMHQGKCARVTERGLSKQGAELLKRICVPAHSICVSCIGWQMGEVIMTDRPSFTNQQINTIVPNAKVEPSFLYYSLRTRKSELLSLGSATGVRTPILNKSSFCDLKVPLPPLPTQRRIASILSAYDDLIENSQRRIKILESMARGLYREWFVHFRFPGHENTRIVDGLPEGWRRGLLEEIAEFKLGKMLDQDKNRGDLLPYLANINVRWGEFDLRDLRRMRFEADELETYGLKYGDIVMCEGGEPGRCAIWKEQLPGMMLQKAIHRIRCRKNMDHNYLYHSLRHFGQSGHLATFFTGSTIKHLPREKLAKLSIVVPPTPLLNNFRDPMISMEGQVYNLQCQIQNLRRTRDLLLPRLLSGQVDLKEV